MENIITLTTDNLSANVHAPLWTFLIIAALVLALVGMSRRR